MKMIRAMVATMAMACASLPRAGAPILTELGREIPGYQWPGKGFAVADFDRDGQDDIVVHGVAGRALLQVLGFGPGGLLVKQAVFLPDHTLARVLAVPIAGVPHLVTVSTDGVVRRHAGWPLVEAHVFDIQRSVRAAAVGDIDNNGAMDLVVSHAWDGDGVSVYALATGALRWALDDVAPNDILLGQFDGDPAKEIVLASTPGLVIDGATQAIDWHYTQGFGSYLAAGRFQPGGANQFVAADDWFRFVTFQSVPWTPLWEMKHSDIDAVATFDLDGDGFDDIIEGDGQWGDVNIIDEQTHEIRLSIPHDGHGISALAAWDPDGDGKAGIAFSPVTASVWSTALFTFSDSENGQPLGMLPTGRIGPYQDLALGSVEGQTRLVYSIKEAHPHGGAWVEIEALTGAVLWRSPDPTGPLDPIAITPSDATYSGNGSGGTLLVLAGNDLAPDSSRLIALDAANHQQQWVLDSEALDAVANPVKSLTALDVAAKPVVAACLVEWHSARILLVDAATGTPLWDSVAMSTADSECGLMAGRFTDAGNPLLVAVLDSSLRAYDAQTHLLAWTLPVAADGATLLDRGVSGREFVVFAGSVLHFHDAATREPLRSFDVGVPVTAVRQLHGDLHGLVVAAGGRLMLIDGTNGAIRYATGYLGSNLAAGNRIATAELGGGYARVGVGSDGGVFRFRLYVGDGIFDDGFEALVD